MAIVYEVLVTTGRWSSEAEKFSSRHGRNKIPLFALGYIGLNWDYTADAGTASDAQACLDAAYAANSTSEAVSFDSGTGGCYYHSRLYAIRTRPPGVQPSFWVRIDLHMQMPAVTTCLTDQDARYLLMQLTYANHTCGMASSCFCLSHRRIFNIIKA